MDTASTPSSRTDERGTLEPAADPETGSSGPLPSPEGAAEGDAAAGLSHDATRRAFFRELGRSALTTVGQVAGLADVVGRGTTTAAASLLGIDLRDPPTPAARPSTLARSSTPGAATLPARARAETDDQYRSPYRVTEDAVILLDQRAIPGALEELTCRRGTDIAYYLRIGACRGGPLMAQVAAYGLALTARERRVQPAETRAADLRRSRDALVAARPSSRVLAWATRRMAAAEAALGPEPDGDALAEALRVEADAIATRLQVDLDAIADHLATRLTEAHESATAGGPPNRPLGVLVHGDPGALWGGLVGPGVAAIGRVVESGRKVRVVLTEARPFMEGARLAAWELRQARIGHQLIADTAVAWLFDRQPIDVVVIAAEAVAANGDAAALVGSRAIADLAAAATSRESASSPRVLVIATGTMIDPDTPDGRALPDERRPVREVGTFLVTAPVPGTEVLNPAVDVIPAERIDTLITEGGPITAPSRDTVVAAARD